MTEDLTPEIELKLSVAPPDLDALAAALAATGFTLREKAQSSVYFDTPDRALHAAEVSFRIRTLHGNRTQTIKGDGRALAGLFTRQEWERSVPDDTPEFDERAARLVPDTTVATLVPAFVVEVTRRDGTSAFEGATIEAAVDLGRIVSNDRIEEFAEVELELKSGSPGSLFALARLLGEAAPVRPGVLAKADRGYRLLDGSSEKVAKATPGDMQADLTASAVFQHIVSSCLRQFRLNEDLLAQTGQADALHQARVALRRLRSALSIFRPLVEDDRFAHLRDELRWLAATLGEARDIDVLIAHGETSPILQEARATAYTIVSDALGSARTRTLLLDLVEWSITGAWRTAAQSDRSAARFAADTLDRLRRKLKMRGKKLAKVDDEHRHQVRIEAKKLRYAAEFFAGLFDGRKAKRRSSRFIKAVRTLQEVLGDLNDIAAANAVRVRWGLPEHDGSASPSRELIADAADAFDELIDRKRFWR